MKREEDKIRLIRRETGKDNILSWISHYPVNGDVTFDEIAIGWQDMMIKGMSTWDLMDETLKWVSACFYKNKIDQYEYSKILKEYFAAVHVADTADDVYDLSSQALRTAKIA